MLEEVHGAVVQHHRMCVARSKPGAEFLTLWRRAVNRIRPPQWRRYPDALPAFRDFVHGEGGWWCMCVGGVWGGGVGGTESS